MYVPVLFLTVFNTPHGTRVSFIVILPHIAFIFKI